MKSPNVSTNAIIGARASHIWRWAALGVVCLVMLLLPLAPGADTYIIGLIVRGLITIALAQAWNVIAGIGGQLSLGHGIFFGIGAYVTVLLFNLWNVSPWTGLPAGIVLSTLVALIIGAITLRLRGVYFALATIVISLCFERLARYFVDITGGDAGLAERFAGESLWAAQSRSPVWFLYTSFLLVIVFYFFSRWLLASRFGLHLQAVRDDQDAAASSGVHVFRTKLIGLSVSAAMTALVGTLHAQFYLTIDPGVAFGLVQAIQIQLPALIGGIATAGGPIVGGALLLLASEMMNRISTAVAINGVDVLGYGLIILIVTRFAPFGILGRRRGHAG